jgi:hypothetical protein
VQAFLPLLRASKGTVIFNTALMARTVIPFNGGYAASMCVGGLGETACVARYNPSESKWP